MTGAEIRKLRSELNLTQAQLGQLLGVHAVTISRWEHGHERPSPHNAHLLETFRTAKVNDSGIGETVAKLLIGASIALALLMILQAAFKKKGDET